jgi:hypothetical protein
MSGGTGFVLEPDYEPLELGDLADEPFDDDPKEEDEEIAVFKSKDKHLIDMKSALSISLLAVSLLGILFVVLRKTMEKKEMEKEKELEVQLRAEKRKLLALKQQAEEDSKGTIAPPATGGIGELVASFEESPDFEGENPFAELDELDETW